MANEWRVADADGWWWTGTQLGAVKALAWAPHSPRGLSLTADFHSPPALLSATSTPEHTTPLLASLPPHSACPRREPRFASLSSLAPLGLTPDLLRSVTDPEHPVSLEQLRVVSREDIHVVGNRVLVYLTPTIPHCSMSTLIGESSLGRGDVEGVRVMGMWVCEGMAWRLEWQRGGMAEKGVAIRCTLAWRRATLQKACRQLPARALLLLPISFTAQSPLLPAYK